ncbi:hypothetical protein [Vibrio sp. 10N.261.55.A7]|uniref:hypothetical protein n=1 Tax=Vibrio sp. 10N.261.55.A7 TaxID=1880851 RepID=UPI0018E40CA5|nr:hypothetical protein [Vibrio sp. 10N.261.55.A7]
MQNKTLSEKTMNTNRIQIMAALLMSITLLFGRVAIADELDSGNIYSAQTEQYAMVNAVGKLLSLTKWKVEVDFGQALKIGVKNKDLLRDSEGKVINFNSPIDAINYLNSQGWALVTVSTAGDQFSAVMKRDVMEEE